MSARLAFRIQYAILAVTPPSPGFSGCLFLRTGWVVGEVGLGGAFLRVSRGLAMDLSGAPGLDRRFADGDDEIGIDLGPGEGTSGGSVTRMTTVAAGGDPEERLLHLLEALPVALLPPSVLVVPLTVSDGGSEAEREGSTLFSGPDAAERFDGLVRLARRNRLGLCLLSVGARDADGAEAPYRDLGILLPDAADSWKKAREREGFSLLLVTAWKLHRAWSLTPRLIGSMSAGEEEAPVRRAVDEILELMRIRDVQGEVLEGSVAAVVGEQPADALLLIGLVSLPSLETARDIAAAARCDRRRAAAGDSSNQHSGV